MENKILGQTPPGVAGKPEMIWPSLFHIMGKIHTSQTPCKKRALDIVEVALNNEPSEPEKLHQRRATSLNNLRQLT
ncbi:hypothetical protein BGS_1416 [Beggiatoa sp. SS]|nr:hypothetical protein BGS_1416 [Beggiatoa sp. SS]